MVFDAHKRRLIIFAGKKRDTFLADMYSFDVTTHEVTEMIADFSALGGPDPCFCQRAAVDPESGHIFVYVVKYHSLTSPPFKDAQSSRSSEGQRKETLHY